MSISEFIQGRHKVLMGACLMLAAVSVGSAVLAANVVDKRDVELRRLRVEVQKLERRVQRLGNPRALETLVALEHSRDQLRLQLAEALIDARAERGVGALSHSLSEQAVPSAKGATNLRLVVEGRLFHGAALLDVLSVVQAATTPWPTETRGCQLGRVETGVRVDCTLDILHWEDLQVATGG